MFIVGWIRTSSIAHQGAGAQAECDGGLMPSPSLALQLCAHHHLSERESTSILDVMTAS